MAGMESAVDGGYNFDWIITNTACFAASRGIAQTLSGLNNFIFDVCDSQTEVADITSLLQSLNDVVGLLKENAHGLPPNLARPTPAMLDGGCAIIEELNGCITVLGRNGIPLAEKKARWFASRHHIGKLINTLVVYRAVIRLAVDLIIATSQGKGASDRSVQQPVLPKGGDDKLSAVASRIRETSIHLQQEAKENAALGSLSHYLAALHDYALHATGVEGRQLDGLPPVPGHLHDPPAVVQPRDGQSPFVKNPTTHPILGTRTDAIEDINELLDALGDCPSRPPTPPPMSRARSKSAPMPHGAGSGVLDGAEPPSPPEQSFWLLSAAAPATNSVKRCDHGRLPTGSIGTAMQRENRGPRDAAGTSLGRGHHRHATDVRLSTAFTLDKGTKIEQAIQTSPAPHQVEAWHRLLPREASQPTLSPSNNLRMTGPEGNKVLPYARRRSNSSRFTEFMSRSLSLRRKGSNTSPPPPTPSLAAAFKVPTPPPSIFNSSLTASMEIARGLAPVTHPFGQSTTQSFPLCVLRCVYFIRSAPPPLGPSSTKERSGVCVPHVFAMPSSPASLSHLIDIFSSPMTGYGKDIDWSPFDVHDAAALIKFFMSSLPAPLVPEQTAKRWVSMSRQANISGTAGTRVEQTLDFWEEALGGIKGGPERGMVKLLLGLWGEVAGQAEMNEMTAERLADCVMESLMGSKTVQRGNRTDYLLGLAFLIRKRADYLSTARGI